MRVQSLLGEAWRNILTGTARVTSLALVFGVILSALTLADVVVVGALVKGAQEFQSRGASTITVAAPDRISGEACESLARIEGVQAAGAIRSSHDSLEMAVLPRSPVAINEVSPGFPSTLNVSSQSTAGVFVSTEVIKAAGVDVGDSVLTDRGRAEVAGSYEYPSDGRRPGLGWAVLVPVSQTERFDECWARIWPWNDEIRSMVKGVVLSVGAGGRDDVQIVQSQLNTQLGTNFSGYERYVDRITRFAPVAALLLGCGLSLLAVRLRRLELASRLHDGSRRADLVCQTVLESIAWLVPAFLVASAAALAYSFAIGSTAAGGATSGAFITSTAGVLGGLVGTAIAASLVRERHLFAYFKDR